METVIVSDEREAHQNAAALGIARVGDRIRARVDWYPARAGAVGRILRIEGLSEDRRVIVQWEDPEHNLARFARSDLHIYDMEYFEGMPSGNSTLLEREAAPQA